MCSTSHLCPTRPTHTCDHNSLIPRILGVMRSHAPTKRARAPTHEKSHPRNGGGGVHYFRHNKLGAWFHFKRITFPLRRFDCARPQEYQFLCGASLRFSCQHLRRATHHHRPTTTTNKCFFFHLIRTVFAVSWVAECFR